MNAPLSRYLTQFSAPPVVHAVVDVPSPFEPRISLTEQELAARLEAVAAAARAETEDLHKAELEAFVTTHESAMAAALAAARAEWAGAEAEALTTQLEAASTAIREMIADRVAYVLRPIMSAGLIGRATQELNKALDKLLADPTRSLLSVRGPADLVSALRERHGKAGVEWIVADTIEVTVVADATHIQTRIGAALADIEVTES